LDFILNNNNRYNFFIDKKQNYKHPVAFKNKLNSSELKELETFHSNKYLEKKQTTKKTFALRKLIKAR